MISRAALTRRVAEATRTDADAVAPALPGEAPQALTAKKDRADVTEGAMKELFERARDRVARAHQNRDDSGHRDEAAGVARLGEAALFSERFLSFLCRLE